MIWPKPEREKIPEGHYQFRLNREPELKAFAYTDKNGVEREGRKVVIFATGLNAGGEYQVADAFLPWEDRYKSLCTALGVEHGKDIAVSGAVFEADIRHEADRRDPTKSWPRIVNIVHKGDVPDQAGDDIPFD